MHSFLRAIGFSKIKTRKLLEPIYKMILNAPTKYLAANVSADTKLVQYSKDFGDGIGITLIGEMAMDGSLSIEYYFPYLKSDQLLTQERIFIEKHGDKDAYAGLSDDYSLGMTLIFYVQNVADYVKSTWTNNSNNFINKAYMSALSTKGKIILDVYKPDENDEPRVSRKKLYEKVKEGDETALESLALENMEAYSAIGKRTRKEDILSIVETNFMPSGLETENYAIIGNILNCKLIKNNYSDEEIYILLLEANEMNLLLAINKKDLVGEPMPGRRFKGELWLQGHIVI